MNVTTSTSSKAGNIKFPPISEYKDFSTYLKTLLIINRELGLPISFCFLARKLGWSKSLLKDYVLGRRRLTMRRALEFAQFARMNLWEHERITKLALNFPTYEETPQSLNDTSVDAATAFEDLSKSLQNIETLLTSKLIFLSKQETRVIKSKISDIRRALKRYEDENAQNLHAKSDEPKSEYFFEFTLTSILSKKPHASVEFLPTHSLSTSP